MKKQILFALALLCAALPAVAQVIPAPSNPASVCANYPSPCVTLTGTLSSGNGLAAQHYIVNFKPTQFLIVPGISAVVPSTSVCATDATGSIVGVLDPTAAPTVTPTYGGGSLAAGTYYVTYTYVDWASHQTVASPESTVILTATGGFTVQPPSLTLPQNVTGYDVYAGATSGGETYQGTVTGTGTYTQSTALTTGSAAPATNATLCQQVANDAAWPTGTGYVVSLVDPDGNSAPGYPMQWQLAGAGSAVNLSSGLPYYHGVVYFPSAIVAAPSNQQTQVINGKVITLGLDTTAANTWSYLHTFKAGIAISGPGGGSGFTKSLINGDYSASGLTPQYGLVFNGTLPTSGYAYVNDPANNNLENLFGTGNSAGAPTWLSFDRTSGNNWWCFSSLNCFSVYGMRSVGITPQTGWTDYLYVPAVTQNGISISYASQPNTGIFGFMVGVGSQPNWAIKSDGTRFNVLLNKSAKFYCYSDNQVSQTCSIDSATGTFTSNGYPLPVRIYSGQFAMPTTSVSANTCSASTVTATGVLATDVVQRNWASSVVGVAGYDLTTGAHLTVNVYPSANTINIERCNSTASPITPAAMNLNLAVMR